MILVKLNMFIVIDMKFRLLVSFGMLNEYCVVFEFILVLIRLSSKFNMIIVMVLISELEVSIIVLIRFSIISVKYLVGLKLNVNLDSGVVNVVSISVVM